MGFSCGSVCVFAEAIVVGWEILWSCRHSVSLVKICVGDINGIDHSGGVCLMLKQHKRLYS